MKLHVSKNIEELSKHVAEWLINYSEEVLSKHDRFTIALSGGNTPKQLYRLLASDKYKKRIDWKRIHFFWGDERFVPFADDRNNAKMAFENLLNRIPIQKKQVHIIQTDTDQQTSAISYENLLHKYFDKQLYSFDLVLLGLGDNGHTLSLFPGYDDIIFEKEKWVTSFYLKEQKTYRITLTTPIVNNAGCVAFLVAGNDKAEALQRVTSGKYNPGLYPAQLIQPLNGELYWFADEAAASGLQHKV